MMALRPLDTGRLLPQLLDGFVADAAVPDVLVRGLALDSRQVQAGDLFLACAGTRVHGLAFAAQAVRRGAAAVAWEPGPGISADLPARVPAVAVPELGRRLGPIAARFHGEPARDLQLIGVTGTDGKTSVTHFIAEALSEPGRPAGLLGTLGYGPFGALGPASHTTPDAVRLQAELASLRGHGVRQAALEVSSHALSQYRTEGITFHTAVLTQLARDHLDYHGSIEAYAAAKRRLFRTPGLACAVLNADDAFGRELAGTLDAGVRILSWQTGPAVRPLSADWLRLAALERAPQGMVLRVESSFGPVVFRAGLLGDFNAANLMAALAVLLGMGMDPDEAGRRLAGVHGVPGRMELFSAPGRPRVVVDYAHTAHALQTVLENLRHYCPGRLWCVFGAGGERDTGKRPRMGAAAEAGADRVILTSDNPRGEDPAAIIEQIAAGMREPARALRIPDRAAAIDAALAAAAPEDLVLVAGKGHEQTQQVGDRLLRFSDRAYVAARLQEADA